MLELTPVKLSDISRLVNLENQIFVSDRISARQFRYLITKGNCILIKAEEGSTLLGYIALLQRKTSRKLRIYSIGVVHTARKQGVASQLISRADKLARDLHCNMLTLEVCDTNISAIRLYMSVGFKAHNLKNNYYEDGSAALQLYKNIVFEEIP